MKRIRRFATIISFAILICLSVPVYAGSSDAYTKLGTLIVAGKETETSGVSIIDTTKTYTATGGGVVRYSDLVSTSCASTGYIVEGNFELLTSSSKEALLTDLLTVVDSAKSANTDITSDTLSTWNQCLQSCNGVDVHFLAALMSGTKPDFVSAFKMYQPFQSPVGTILGVITLLMFSAITISTVIDLCYLGVPMFNTFVSGDSKEKPGCVSVEAYRAYLEQAGSAGGQGANGKSGFKNAVGIYFKHRVVMLALLFVSILYLVSGQIWSLFADIASLFGGLVG